MELMREPYEDQSSNHQHHLEEEELEEERIIDDSNDELLGGNRERSNTSPPPSIFTSPPSQPLSPNTVDSIYNSLPLVPQHDPRSTSFQQKQQSGNSIDLPMVPSSTGILNRIGHLNNNPASPSLTPRHLSISSGSGSVGNPATLCTPDEGGQDENEEEELEELEDTDDEVEEMAEEHNHIRLSEEVTLPDRLETRQLVELTRSVCLSFVQHILHNMSHNSTFTKLIGGSSRMDKLSRAADETSNQIIQSTFSSNSQNKSEEFSKVQQSFERMAVLVVNAVDEVEATTQNVNNHYSIAMEDLKLIKALSTLLATLDPEKLQDTLSQSRSPSSSTMPSTIATAAVASSSSSIEHRQRAGVQRGSISGSSSGDLRSPTTSPHWTANNPSSSTAAANNALASSPSSSREELRNPFADDELRISQSGGGGGGAGCNNSVGNVSNATSFDEKWRDRALILGGSATSDGEAQRLIKYLDEIEKRCHGSTNERGELIPQTSNVASLQAQIGAGRSLLVTRRSESISTNPLRHRSISPSSPSPTFGLSQRNSRASSPAFNSTQPHEQVVGDPTGEAFAAGMMGNIGGVSRAVVNKSSSSRNSISFIPNAPSLARRNSTKSEKSFGLHSPPPRYSEDSTRSWANMTFPPLTGQDASAVSGLNTNGLISSTGIIRRRRSVSSDVLPGFSTGPPAYAKEAFQNPQQGFVEEKRGSVSSSVAQSESGGATRTTSKVQYDEKEAMIAMDEEKASTNQNRSLHPAHELKMLQNGIDRLMDAAPPMNDQRVGLPDPNKRAIQRESELRQMVERISKTGRLDDQRASLPTRSMSPITGSALYGGMPRETVVGEGVNNLGIGMSPASTSYATQTQVQRSSPPLEKSSRTRRFPSVGSISLGSLAIRRASNLLDSGIRSTKGKDRGDQPRSPGFSSPSFENRAKDDYDDLESVTSRLASASMRKLNDQRFAPPSTRISRSGSSNLLSGISSGGEKTSINNSEMKEKPDKVTLTLASMIGNNNKEDEERVSIDSFDLSPPPVRRGKSKLATMGIETNTNYDEDDPLFEMINTSTSGRRMSDQDVVKGKSMKENNKAPPASLKTSHSRLLRNIQPNEITDLTLENSNQSKEIKSSPRPRSSIEGDYVSAQSSIVSARSGGELKTSIWHKARSDTKEHPDVVNRNRINGQENDNVEFACIAETQERLGWLLVQIWITNAKDTLDESDEISYEVISPKEGGNPKIRIHSSQNQEFSFEIPFCIQVSDISRGKINKQDGIWLLRLPIDKNLLERSHNEFGTNFSLTQILKSKPEQWECVTCGNSLLNTSTIKKYISLPSQHWEELVDAWMCHTDQELNESLLKAQKDLDQHAGLEKGQVHVSDTQLITTMEMVIKDNLLIKNEKQQEDDPSELICKNCQTTIGEMGIGQISKMFKYAIRPTKDFDDNYYQKIQYPSFASFMAEEFIRKSHISATRNFILTTRTKNGIEIKKMAIWLFLDDFQISIKPGEKLKSLINLPNTFTACKVMFRLPGEMMTNENQKESFQSNDNWTSPEMEDSISFPSDWLDKLIQILQASNESYPKNQRIFSPPIRLPLTDFTQQQQNKQSWHTGFLPRI